MANFKVDWCLQGVAELEVLDRDKAQALELFKSMDAPAIIDASPKDSIEFNITKVKEREWKRLKTR